jgi:hypothetical protein
MKRMARSRSAVFAVRPNVGRVTIGLVAGLASWVSTLDGRATASAGDLVTALIAAEPRDLLALEAVIGPVRRDPRRWTDAVGPLRRAHLSALVAEVTIGLAIDLHHQDPRRVTNPPLKDYRLRLAAGRSEALAALQKAGAVVRLTDGGTEVLRFGRFYARTSAGDGFVLEWHATEPRFAQPRPSGPEQAALVDRVVSVLREGPSRAVLQRQFGELRLDRDWGCDAAAGSGWSLQACPSGAARPGRLSLRFKPPLPGDAIVAALAVTEPVVVATDVHMTTRYLLDWKSRAFPMAHGYRVTIAVPTVGLEMTDRTWPASPVWRAPRLQVMSIDFEPPR